VYGRSLEEPAPARMFLVGAEGLVDTDMHRRRVLMEVTP
jgi:hypothetical protein